MDLLRLFWGCVVAIIQNPSIDFKQYKETTAKEHTISLKSDY